MKSSVAPDNIQLNVPDAYVPLETSFRLTVVGVATDVAFIRSDHWIWTAALSGTPVALEDGVTPTMLGWAESMTIGEESAERLAPRSSVALTFTTASAALKSPGVHVTAFGPAVGVSGPAMAPPDPPAL